MHRTGALSKRLTSSTTTMLRVSVEASSAGGVIGAEGKVANAVAAWGKTGHSYASILAWLTRLIAYLGQPATEYIYPTHVMKDEQKRSAGNARKLAAKAKVTERRKQIAAKRGAK